MKNLHDPGHRFTHVFKNNTDTVVEIIIRRSIMCVVLPGECIVRMTVDEYRGEISFQFKGSQTKEPFNDRVSHICSPHLDMKTLLPFNV